MTESKFVKTQVLRPKHEVLFVEGMISYGKSQRAFNMIRMKDPVLREFPQLFERRNKFGYGMTLHRSFKEAIKALKEMEKKGETLPMFLEFYRISP